MATFIKTAKGSESCEACYRRIERGETIALVLSPEGREVYGARCGCDVRFAPNHPAFSK